MTPMSTVLIGDESLLAGCGAHLLEQGHTIRAVVTQDAATSRWAADNGLTVLHRIADLIGPFAAGDFDWLLSIANLRLIGADVLALPARGAVNFHDGPLPRYAGLNAPAWALRNGEETHGVTWHLIGGGIDAGDILEQRLFEIAPDETAFTLNSKCYAAAMESFPDLVAQLAGGTPGRRPQDPSQRSYFGRDLRPGCAGWLDHTQPATDLARQVRALDFGGYRNPLVTPKIILDGEWLAVGTARPGQTDDPSAPGTVVGVAADGLCVATGAGLLTLDGLRRLDGTQIDPAMLAAAGDTLGTPDAADAEVAAEAARAERQWSTDLHALSPSPLALAAPAQGAPRWERHALAVETDATALALGTLALARMSTGDPAAAIALRTVDHPLLSPWVPMRAEADATLAEARAAVERTCAAAAEAGPFPVDMTQRDPALAGIRQPDFAFGETPLTGSALTVTPDGACLFDGSRLTAAARDLLVTRLETILERMPSAQRLEELQALVPAEAETLDRLNATETDRDGPQTLHGAVAAQAARTPEATALVFEETCLTHAQLEARANGLARALLAEGVGPGCHVGLCVARGPQLLIAALGILKAGAAYVPLDSAYPAERLAHYVADSAASVIVTEDALRTSLPPSDAKVIMWDQGTGAPLPEKAGADDTAYLIYTSGSTGTPKGVMVSHGNVTNFFIGMDAVVERKGDDVWLAVTSIAFDISVLELFYTLARGFKLVLVSDAGRAALADGPITGPDRRADFSLYYWSNDCAAGRGKYDLLLEGAKFADAHAFDAIWTPERHFHAFGGQYPNPAVTGAAVAAITKNLQVRAGSCVAPLHHPARIAEDWAVIDNLTDGGAGLAMASGWQPDDFILRPENTPPDNKAALFETIDQLRRLWRGEEVAFPTRSGEMHAVVTQPRPVSAEVPIWVTTAGNPETWREAGRIGANVLTHLLGQSIAEVGEKITLYHAALRAAGFDPDDRVVTVMLHTLIGEDREAVMETARGPLKAYLRSAAGLIRQYAWAFPAFKKPEGVRTPFDLDLSALDAEEMEAILDFAFERYFHDAGLFGTVEDGIARVEELKALGVGEIACLIDYGIPNPQVLAGLPHLNAVRARSNAGVALRDDDHSLAAALIRHRVTHLQCTPSLARMITASPEARRALGGLRHLYLGGEALPGALLEELRCCTRARITNMYGPTETTIWSTTQAVTDDGRGKATLPIGAPLANQSAHVLDAARRPVPLGVSGELYIGGAGVTRGYWQRPELTAERFVQTDAGRLYATGDLVRRRVDGQLEFLGRRDSQVKIRGQRIELGEIEARIAGFDGLREAVVIARDTEGGAAELAAYVLGELRDEGALRTHLAAHLPEVMVPRHIVPLAQFPLTPNGKIDRAALPAPEAARPPAPQGAAPVSGAAAEIAAVWARILGVAEIRAEDSFFDLGGHSLLAVQAHRALRDTLELPRLSIIDIFRFPTLNALAAHIDSLRGATPAPDTPDTGSGLPDRAATMSRRKAMRIARERRAG